MKQKNTNDVYNSLYPSFLEEKKEEATKAFKEWKKNNNIKYEKIIINCYLDIIRLELGEYAYKNHLKFINKSRENFLYEFNCALEEFKLVVI